MKLNTNSGIYEIYNTFNNKRYIGSAVNFSRRFKHHISRLRNNNHNNKHLQRAWNKYGEKAFKFNIVCLSNKEELLKIEQWFLNSLKPQYNICTIAGNTIGIRHSEEVIKIIASKNRGRKASSKEIEKRRLTTVPQEKRQKIIEYLNLGYNYTKICEDLKTSYTVILKVKQEFGKFDRYDYFTIKRNDNKKYYTEAEACRDIGCVKGTINKCIKKNYKCKGFNWFKINEL